MSHFSYQNGVLCAENTPLPLIAKQFGTPAYVYSKAALVENFSAYADACIRHGRDSDAALVCYSVKSNSNLAVLGVLNQLGSGFDIVSGGELLRVLAAGGAPSKVIFSGVGKTRDEMRLALSHDIACFNVESIPELHRLNEIAAELGKQAPVSLRVNPNVDAKTHPYISTGLKENKFGVAYEDALATYRIAAALPYIRVVGIDCHIGSLLLDDAPLLEALDKLIDLIDTLGEERIPIHHLDIGGGIGINYEGDQPVAVGDYFAGPSHVLPTGGLARSYSGLSTADFVRWTTFQTVAPGAAALLASDVGEFAKAEGLFAHANAALGWKEDTR